MDFARYTPQPDGSLLREEVTLPRITAHQLAQMLLSMPDIPVFHMAESDSLNRINGAKLGKFGTDKTMSWPSDSEAAEPCIILDSF
jgi:hypothetical protein